MQKFRTRILATAALTAVGIGSAGTAAAAPLGYGAAGLDISDFTIQDPTDDSVLNEDAFSFLNIENTSINQADLNSVSGVSKDQEVGVDPDASLACQGDCGFGENDFTSSGPVDSHFVRGDTRISGAVLDGLAPDAPARAQSLAELAFNRSEELSDTNATNESTSRFEFVSDEDRQIQADFTADAFVRAFLDSEVFGPASGITSELDWSITIENLDDATEDIQTFSPDPLTLDTSAILAGEDRGRSTSQSFEENFSITGGDRYAFDISHTNTVTGRVEIPTPATIALLGLGCLGMAGFVRRRGHPTS